MPSMSTSPSGDPLSGHISKGQTLRQRTGVCAGKASRCKGRDHCQQHHRLCGDLGRAGPQASTMAANNEPMQVLLDKLQSLPPEHIAEVEDFIDFLRQRDAEACVNARSDPTDADSMGFFIFLGLATVLLLQ